MRFLCLAYGNRQKVEALTRAEYEAIVRDCQPFMKELNGTGRVVFSGSLSWDVTTIRPRNGKALVTDGPFVETKEQVGGLFVVEAADLSEAIRLASNHPAAHLGENLGWAIEVHPMDVPE